MPIEKLALPVGRIVGGNPAVAQTKTNFQTGQAVLDKNGQPAQQWRCEIAYPKDVFLSQIYPLLQKEALTAFPNWQQLLDPQTGMPLAQSDFAWKFVDGDSPLCPKRSQVPYNAREGYPGHYVLKISTEAFAPGIFKFENGSYRKLEAHEIKCGDYVVANVDIKVHTNNDGGLYINPNGFELVGYGTAIAGQSGGGDPNALFGGQQHQLPPGASTAPVGAPAGSAMPQMGVPQNPQFPPFAGVVQGTPAPMMGNAGIAAQSANNPALSVNTGMPLPPPAHDFLANAGVPQAPQFGGVPNAGVPQPTAALPTATPTAIPATTYPTNGIPGLPPAR